MEILSYYHASCRRGVYVGLGLSLAVWGRGGRFQTNGTSVYRFASPKRAIHEMFLTSMSQQFNTYAATIEDAMRSRFTDIDKIFEGLAESITGAAITSGQKFPFVTVPMFEIQGEHARKASGIEVLTFAPLVAEENRLDWEKFANANQEWLQESRDISLSNGEPLQQSGYLDEPITPFIYQHESLEPPFLQIPAVDAPFLPAWHVSVPSLSKQNELCFGSHLDLSCRLRHLHSSQDLSTIILWPSS